jgi:aminobenzoyl-glutamate transport protein
MSNSIRVGPVDRFLGIVERAGNMLPHPATLFFLLTVFVVIASWLASQFDISVAHPKSGELVSPVNLLSADGLQRIMSGLVSNFTGFAPLGTVLVALIGIGVAEHSGFIGACLRIVVLNAPRFLLTPIIVFAGVMSNMASEIGYVLLVPLSGLLFVAAGRHPILGMRLQGFPVATPPICYSERLIRCCQGCPRKRRESLIRPIRSVRQPTCISCRFQHQSSRCWVGS